MSPDKRREEFAAWLFIAPAVVLIGLFGLLPVVNAFWVSLNSWRITRRGWAGLANYERVFGDLPTMWAILAGALLLSLGVYLRGRARVARTTGADGATLWRRWTLPTIPTRVAGWAVVAVGLMLLIVFIPRVWFDGDDDMVRSLQVTVFYSLGAVPVQLVGGLLLAVALDQRLRAKQLFRVIFLLPYIVPTVAAAAVFQTLFSLRPESFANQVIQAFGAEPLQWLGEARGIFDLFFGWTADAVDAAASPVAAYWATWAEGPSLALVSIILFNYWVYIGYYALIYSNGLSQIDRQLFEAAAIDGAGPGTLLRRIIVPLLSPTTFFLTMLGIIGTFKSFTSIYILRNPATRGATDPMSVYIFFTFIRRQRLDQATTMAVVLFLIVLAITLYQRRRESELVHYGD